MNVWEFEIEANNGVVLSVMWEWTKGFGVFLSFPWVWAMGIDSLPYEVMFESYRVTIVMKTCLSRINVTLHVLLHVMWPTRCEQNKEMNHLLPLIITTFAMEFHHLPILISPHSPLSLSLFTYLHSYFLSLTSLFSLQSTITVFTLASIISLKPSQLLQQNLLALLQWSLCYSNY